MLFDAVVNLFRTVCIGLIAISPIIIYKVLDEPIIESYKSVDPSNNSFTLINESNQNSSRNSQLSDSTNNAQFQIFSHPSLFGSQPSIPPPPPPPVDIPIDSGVVYLLLIGISYGIFKTKKLKVLL